MRLRLVISLILLFPFTTHAVTAYLPSDQSSVVQAFDFETKRLKDEMPLPTAGNHITCLPDGSALYISHTETNTISKIILPAGIVSSHHLFPGKTPTALAADPTGKRLYILLSTANQMIGYDIANREYTTATDTGENPTALAVHPVTGSVYVVAAGAARLTIRKSDGTIRKKDLADRDPRAIAISPDGKRIYISHYGTDRVSVLSAETLERLAGILVGNGPGALAITSDSRFIGVQNRVGTLTIINAEDYSIRGTLRIGNDPAGLGVPLNGNRFFAVDRSGRSIHEINPELVRVTETHALSLNRKPLARGNFLCQTPPEMPANFTAKADGTHVRLSWTDKATKETGYRIQRRSNADGNITQLADLPPNTQSFTDKDRKEETAYTYTLWAFHEGANSLRAMVGVTTGTEKEETSCFLSTLPAPRAKDLTRGKTQTVVMLFSLLLFSGIVSVCRLRHQRKKREVHDFSRARSLLPRLIEDWRMFQVGNMERIRPACGNEWIRIRLTPRKRVLPGKLT